MEKTETPRVRGRKKGSEVDGMADSKYVERVRTYTVVAGECPAAPAGSEVFAFLHTGRCEAGEIVTYAGGDGPRGVTFGRVLDVLFRDGGAVYLISRQDPAEPPIEVPDSEVLGEVFDIITPEDMAAIRDEAVHIFGPSQTVGGHGGTVGAGPVRVSRPRRSRRRR